MTAPKYPARAPLLIQGDEIIVDPAWERAYERARKKGRRYYVAQYGPNGWRAIRKPKPSQPRVIDLGNLSL